MEKVSMSLDRRGQEALRRMESRLKEIEAGIARHEARMVELRGIRDRVQKERDSFLASLASPVPAPAEEPKSGEGEAAETGRAERPGVKSGPPPEAEHVPGAVPQDFWTRFQSRTETERPRVLYSWPSSSSDAHPPSEGDVRPK